MRSRCLLALILVCAAAQSAHAVDKEEIRRRFMVVLESADDCAARCMDGVRNGVSNLGCVIESELPRLRMLNARCELVVTTKDSILMNWAIKEIPGVRDSTPDTMLRAGPSNSDEVDAGDSLSPDTPMFMKSASRMEAENGYAPYNWGLDRIDEDMSPLDNAPVDFSCYPKQGLGVRVFIIDTGCMTEHGEFSDATIRTMTAPGSTFNDSTDFHGHGTHIAGVIVGKHVGIARNSDVTCIKAFNQDSVGAATDSVSAVEYVLEEKAKDTSVPFVVNLSYSSLTGLTVTALDEIVFRASSQGIVFAVAAGNAAVSACLFSPSKAQQAFTVTASTQRDTVELDSNIGSCVEFIAPGHNIVSASTASSDDYKSLNGTSMATPHITGLSALVLAENPNMQYSPSTVRDTLYSLLLTRRSVQVSEFAMPLMETGCGDNAPRVPSSATPLPLSNSSEIMQEKTESEPAPAPRPTPSLIPSVTSTDPRPSSSPAAQSFVAQNPKEQELPESSVSPPVKSPPAAQSPAVPNPDLQSPAVPSPGLQSPAMPSPSLQSLAVQSPTVQNTAGKSPAMQSPAAPRPALQSPVVQSPAMQSPVVQSPAAPRLAAQSPSPAVQSPVVQSPVVQNPTTPRPAVQSPVAQSPVVQSSATQSSAEQSPDTQISATQYPRIQSPKEATSESWGQKRAWEMEQDLGRAPTTATSSYYHYGLEEEVPEYNPYTVASGAYPY